MIFTKHSIYLTRLTKVLSYSNYEELSFNVIARCTVNMHILDIYMHLVS